MGLGLILWRRNRNRNEPIRVVLVYVRCYVCVGELFGI